MTERTLYQTQAEALIGKLRQEQNDQARKLQGEASAWSRNRLQQARRKARLLVADAVTAERENLRKEVAAAEASITAQQRHRHQVYIARVLDKVMSRIPALLIQRWQQSEARQAWLKAALGEAERRLGLCEWHIRYAPGMETEDMALLGNGHHAHWLEDPTLAAGLVIQKRGARLDASVSGLMADPVMLHGRILALLQHAHSRAQTHE